MTIGLWQKLLLPEASIGMRLVRCLRWFRIKGRSGSVAWKIENIPLLGTEEVADFIPAKEGAYPEGVIGIRAPQSEDLVFRAGKPWNILRNRKILKAKQESFDG